MIRVAIRNLSTVISAAELTAALTAFKTQISRDFFPPWGIDARLRIVPRTGALKAGEWELAITDDADEANALGYHDVTSIGTPLGKVFAKTTLDAGYSWTVTVSHELLEMLLDPWVNLTALDTRTMRLYAYEACDAVEEDSIGYSIGGTQVSDFVLPEFFEADITVAKPRSFCGHVTKPFSLARGGYLSFLDLRNLSKGWQQISARKIVKPTIAAPSGRPGTSRGALRRKVQRIRKFKRSRAS